MCEYSFSELNLSEHKIKILYRAGIHTIKGLTSKTTKELMALRGFDGAEVLQLRRVLFQIGLSLADTSDLSMVNSLFISPYIINALHKAGIYTIKDLTSKTTKELMAVPRFGRRVLSLVKEAMIERGFDIAAFDLRSSSLVVSPRVSGVLHKADIHTIKDLTSKTTKELMALPDFTGGDLLQLRRELLRKGLSLSDTSDLSMVNSLFISPYIINAFHKAGIYTIKDLTSKTTKELMALPDFTGGDLLQLRRELLRKGLSLSDTSDLSMVNSLFISPYIINAFHKAGIYTIKDLTSKTTKELMALPDFIGGDLLQLRGELFQMRLSLADTSDPSMVSSLFISPRSINALHRAGIYTIEDSASKTTKELMALPNFTGGDLVTLRYALLRRGLSLADTSDLSMVNSLLTSPSSINALHKAGIYTIKSLLSKTTKELMALPGFGKKAHNWVKEVLSERGFDIAAFDLWSSSLVVSPRISSALYEAGIHTIKDLTSKTPEELMALPNFGREDFLQLKEALFQGRWIGSKQWTVY